MNKYIKPVFEIIIPKLQSAKIKYWVYGGLGYAAMVGECYRNNMDVDLFTLDADSNTVEHILDDVCKENGWKMCKKPVDGRIKVEIFILKDHNKWVERLSVVFAKNKDKYVELFFKNGSGKYPLDLLQQIERQLEDFSFFTISDQFLKKLFLEYLGSKKKYPLKRVEDARHILLKEEFNKYFPGYIYERS